MTNSLVKRAWRSDAIHDRPTEPRSVDRLPSHASADGGVPDDYGRSNASPPSTGWAHTGPDKTRGSQYDVYTCVRVLQRPRPSGQEKGKCTDSRVLFDPLNTSPRRSMHLVSLVVVVVRHCAIGTRLQPLLFQEYGYTCRDTRREERNLH